MVRRNHTRSVSAKLREGHAALKKSHAEITDDAAQIKALLGKDSDDSALNGLQGKLKTALAKEQLRIIKSTPKSDRTTILERLHEELLRKQREFADEIDRLEELYTALKT